MDNIVSVGRILAVSVIAIQSLKRLLMTSVLVLGLAACGAIEPSAESMAEVSAEVKSADIAGFNQLDKLYTGGLPSADQLKSFAEKGVTTVIDLRRPEEGLQQEQQQLAKLGLNYVNIPLGRTLASVDAQEKFAQAFAAAKGEKVLLHCRSGNRVGMLWSLYQIRQGIEPEIAIEQGRAMGMKAGFEQAVRASITTE